MTLLVAIALGVVVSGSPNPPPHGSMSVTGAGKFRHEGVVAPGEQEQRASMMRKERVVQPAALDEDPADGIAPQVAINLYNAINNGADAFKSVASTINQQAQEIQALNTANSVMTGGAAAASLLDQASGALVSEDNVDPCFGGSVEDCTTRGMQGVNPRCTWHVGHGHAGKCQGILCSAITQEQSVCAANNMCRWDSSVSKCYQRQCKALTTGSSLNWCASSPSCSTVHIGGEDVCVQKPCSGMHEELCHASEKDCLWNPDTSSCKAIRCNGLSATGPGHGPGAHCASTAGCAVENGQCVGCSALTDVQGGTDHCSRNTGCQWTGSKCIEKCGHYNTEAHCESPLHPSCGWDENANEGAGTCETACSNSGVRHADCANADTDYCTDTDPSRDNAWMSATCKRECRTCPVACHLKNHERCGDHPSCLWKGERRGGSCKKVCANFHEAEECGTESHCSWNVQLVPAVCVDKAGE